MCEVRPDRHPELGGHTLPYDKSGVTQRGEICQVDILLRIRSRIPSTNESSTIFGAEGHLPQDPALDLFRNVLL